MNQQKIKIFATQHMNNILIDSDIITPVRAGAYFLDGPCPIQRDDEGENISDKNKMYCELTTQFWAWKNVNLDYYGFCHYRRYFSFNESELESDEWGTVCCDYLDEETIKKLFIDSAVMRSKIEKYDILTTRALDLKKVGIKSVYEQYKNGTYLNVKDLDILVSVIKDKYPEFFPYAKNYLEGSKVYFCNMFILKKELFNQYCSWLFDILFECEKRMDMSNYSIQGLRTPGHLAERLWGIYFSYLKAQGIYKYCELQQATITDTHAVEEIKPAFSSNNVPIVMAANDYFMPYCAAAIQSMIDTSVSTSNYDIMIFENKIPDHTKDRLEMLIKGISNFSIRFFEVARWVNQYKLYEKQHITVETYYRLVIPELLYNFSKVLYLDGDIIIKHDVSELYQTDINDYFVAGAVDIANAGLINGFDKEARDYCDKKLKLKDPYMQFNAGVLLINVAELRKKYSTKFLLEFAEKGEYRYQDQDVLNILCEGKIKWLSPEWNFAADEIGGYRGYVDTFAPKNLYEEYRSAAKCPKIIHYAGNEKPWYNPSFEYAEEFWFTLRKTPFYEIVIDRRAIENGWGIAEQAIKRTQKSRRIKNGCRRIVRKSADIIIPKGTKRRDTIRRYYYKMRGWN